jgi:hypothetical protein
MKIILITIKQLSKNKKKGGKLFSSFFFKY